MKSDTAVFYTAGMESQRARSKFAQKGDLTLVNEDVAVVHLEKPYPGYDPSTCPLLPTASDCKDLNSTLGNASAASRLSANFFKSLKMNNGNGPLQKAEFAPLPRLMVSDAVTLSVDSKNGHLVSSFKSQGAEVHLRKGDSGSALLFKTASGPVVVGIQSAVFQSNDTNALFAQVCSKIESPRWTSVVGK
ncbi:MAG: hypothetical protein EOP05_22030 [Proteobacteria bacterium]|nr:MAG: hypothetical protein EOP05_22030 [Pseudomonadota bacterium]